MSKITDEIAHFSGVDHRIVVRADGRRFWLDPAFMYTLLNRGDDDLSEILMSRFGTTADEAEQIPELLYRAGLIENTDAP